MAVLFISMYPHVGGRHLTTSRIWIDLEIRGDSVVSFSWMWDTHILEWRKMAPKVLS